MYSSFIPGSIVHLASEEMLGALDCDVSVCLVDIDCILKALINLLCQTDLFLGH